MVQCLPDDGFDCKPHHGGQQEEWSDQDVEERQRSKGFCRLQVVPAGIGVGHKCLDKEGISLEKAGESDTFIHLPYFSMPVHPLQLQNQLLPPRHPKSWIPKSGQIS